jgi:sialidase-1
MNGQDVDLSDAGAEVKDVSGNGNDGDAKNEAQPAIGKLGQGFGFDGVDDVVGVSDNTAIDFGNGSFSISTWWKITNTDTDRVLDKRLSGAGYELVPRNDVVSVYLGDGSDSYHRDIGSSNINDGEWHHVVATVAAPDGAGDRTVTVYVDGSYDGETTFTDVGDISSGSDLFIGAANGGSGGVVNGSIDNARIYDRALSADEVEKLYRLGE